MLLDTVAIAVISLGGPHDSGKITPATIYTRTFCPGISMLSRLSPITVRKLNKSVSESATLSSVCPKRIKTLNGL